MVVENQIFLTTPGGKLVRLDGSKRGKLDWDLDLPKPAATPPAYLPIMHRLSFIDTANQLVAVDAKLGKLLWRTPLDNRNPATETVDRPPEGSKHRGIQDGLAAQGVDHLEPVR